jgi:hypothetical protein
LLNAIGTEERGVPFVTKRRKLSISFFIATLLDLYGQSFK